jgi:hypothetical protein
MCEEDQLTYVATTTDGRTKMDDQQIRQSLLCLLVERGEVSL